MCERPNKQVAPLLLTIVLSLIAACASPGPEYTTPEGTLESDVPVKSWQPGPTYTVSGRVSGGWDCYEPAAGSAVPSTITLLPFGWRTHFTLSSPDFAIEHVPNGEYTLVVSCLPFGDLETRIDSDRGFPVTVSGADVFVDIVMPFPALPRHSPVTTFAGHAEWIRGLAFSPNGDVLVSASSDGTLISWDLATGKQLRTLRHGNTDPRQSLVLSADGTTLASDTVNGDIQVWDVEKGELFSTLDVSGRVASLAFSPDGTTLAADVALDSVQIVLWNVETGKHLRTFDVHQDGHDICWGCTRILQDSVTLVVVASDDVENDYVIVWWDATTGNRLRSLRTSDLGIGWPWIASVAISPDEALFAFGLDGKGEFSGGFVLWDATTGRTVKGHHPRALDMAFSPDETLLASTACDNTVLLWDLATGEAQHVLVSDFECVRHATWSPDGAMLAAGASDGTIIIWEMP